MRLFDFQVHVAEHLHRGRSVILQAPTGAGKTFAALNPFLEAWARSQPDFFPRQCIYSVPMRVLANQFIISEDKFIREKFKFSYLPKVAIQTGECSEDPELKGDLIFTTIDQTLSNILGVPYAVGKSRANLNAGAVIGSYLVFDEFHLYPHGEKSSSIGALKTTLQVLTLLKDITPFVLMTATFSSAMLKELKAELGAEIVTVSPEELAQIPSQQNKQRHYHVVPDILNPEAIIDHHQSRSIAICNTVDRAQELFGKLRDHPKRGDAEIVLLHARFTSSDRNEKEKRVLEQFGKEKKYWTEKNLILVATQVIEVGLDITCENLHTEIAPANAIFQRGGRCARFENEKGDVHIYNVPLNKEGEPNYAPYLGIEARLCESAWDAFSKRNGATLDFHGEQEVIDEVHTEADRALLHSMRENEGEIWNLMQYAIIQNDPTTRRTLIRDSSDSCTLLVHDDPETLDNPFHYHGFSIYRGSLYGRMKDLQKWARNAGLKWVVQVPQEKPELEEAEDSKRKIEYDWIPVPLHFEDIPFSPVYVVNPSLVKYDKELGFRFSPDGNANPNILNEPVFRSKHKGPYDYQLEDYPHHIQEMVRVFETRKWHDRLQFAARHLEKQQGWTEGSIESATRLAIALHDVGKMDVRWQAWARKYQEAIGEGVNDFNMMIAHTHSDNENHRRIAKEIHLQRPHHAGEGTIAVAKLVNEYFSQQPNAREALRKISLSAIARHHSSQIDGNKRYQYHLEKNASLAILVALKNAGIEIKPEMLDDLYCDAPPNMSLERQILVGGDRETREWWLAYFLVVRNLRMSDGESQEEK
jgi:CRISPR-associated endonuclease/helicase Cas3